MKILILGGTGAMGVPLVKRLANDNTNDIYITTRSKKENSDRITYIQGNAKEMSFLTGLLEQNFDVIVDFMVYASQQFEDRVSLFLKSTKQYMFFSSARCYANSLKPLSEQSPRLIDVCTDENYLSTDEYALAKGREENILMNFENRNWTIIRPYITYNSYRLQLGVYEKENWLKRALEGRTIVLPREIAEKRTTLTYGGDVADSIAELVGNQEAYGEVFHITTCESHTWEEICDYYCDVIEDKTGNRPRVKIVENVNSLKKVWNPWQIQYDRLYDRTFDNSKIETIRKRKGYKATLEGLKECLLEFMEQPLWLDMNWKYEAWCDKQTGEYTPLSSIPGKRTKLNYLKWRFLK